MRRRHAVYALAIAMLLTLAPTGASADYSYDVPAIEVIKAVNFRTGPSTGYDAIRFLQKGELLEVIGDPSAYWLQVKDGSGVVGYVSSSSTYVKPAVKTVFPEPNATVVASVNFRTGPSTSGNRIRYLKAGEYIWILEQVNDYWYKAADSNNVIGYVSTSDKYVDTNFGTVSEPEEETYIEAPNASIVKSVSFRTGPSTEASRIRYLQTGEPVWIVDKVNSYWYEVKDQNGVIGYVSTSKTYIDANYTEEWKQLTRSQIADRAIEAGMRYLGTPYEFGSSRSDTSTFDCSDFVRQAFLDGIGMTLPGDSRQQASFVRDKQGDRIVTDWRQLQRGDLMFFMAYKGAKKSDYENVNRNTETVRHVGIYLGNGEVLQTYSVASGGVRTDVIAGSQWENRFLYGGAVIK